MHGESDRTTLRQSSWRALLPAAIYWAAVGAVQATELPYFFRFLFGLVAPALLLIAFSFWWWRNRHVSRRERCLGYLFVVGGAFAAAPLLHRSLGVWTALMFGLPVVMTLWTLWELAARRLGPAARWSGAVLVVAAPWSCLALVRSEGLDADLHAALRWRWTQSAEEQFVAQESAATFAARGTAPVEAGAGDWTGFRGAERDGVVRGLRIAADWHAAPPSLVWKRRVGPAWSSIAVVCGRLFTQDQRGDNEAVVCYDAATGAPLWVHQDAARFYESVSGPGPRATPTFAAGRVYAMGATGLLNCLDAADGRVVWSHDLGRVAGAKPPQWGLSASPLVVKGLVIAYGGGAKQNNLLAFQAADGAPAWTAPAGDQSYASPKAATVAGRVQILMHHDQGLTAVDPASGAVLWSAGQAMPGAPKSMQPHVLDGRIFAGTLAGMGIGMIDVRPSGDSWKTEEVWSSSQTKPEFSEFVIHRGHAYGFDGAFFCCVDLATGSRVWKGGRYGRGQVVLLAEQGLLLVLTERGEIALVAARPERHEEFARIQALEGKTWNHPAVVNGRLYVRNAEEMACWQLPVAPP